MFERGESQKLHGIINLAGEEAQTAYQAGLEAGAEEERRRFKEELESKSFQLSVFQSEVKARDESFKRMERELENERAKCQVSEAEAKAAEPRAVEEHLRSEHLRKKARVFAQRLARSERPFEEEQAAKSTDQMTLCAAEVEEYESMIGKLTEELLEFRAKDLEYGRTKPQSRTLEVNTPSFSPLGKRCGGCIKKSSAFKLSGGAWRWRLRIA
jgi:hypothetical protein